MIRHPLAIACLVGALSACGDNQDPDAAAALWDRIQAENYRGFARAPGYEQRQPSNTAHSDQVDIYVNDVMQEAIEGGEPLASWPEGSLVVKDGFDGDGELDLVAAMDKRAGGWFWVEWTDPDGSEPKYSGEPELCIDCHSSGSDFVRAFALPQ
jgi:hypothetical protein